MDEPVVQAGGTVDTAGKLPLSRLRQVLDYDPLTGVFTWKEKIASKVVVGTRAGSLTPEGYRKVRLFGTEYLQHRLAWFYVHGVWPEFIDHRNLQRGDNALSNLRATTRQGNQMNQPRKSSNTSGFKGVGWFKPTRKWRARVTKNGRLFYAGYFDSKEEAHAAYCEAASRAHGEFMRAA